MAELFYYFDNWDKDKKANTFFSDMLEWKLISHYDISRQLKIIHSEFGNWSKSTKGELWLVGNE